MTELIYANPENRKLTSDEVRERMPAVMDEHLAPILDGTYHTEFNADGAQEYVNYLYKYCGYSPPKDFYVTENPREALYTARKVLKDEKYTYSLFYACSIYSSAYWAWHKFIKDNCKPDFEHADALDSFYNLYMNARIFASALHEDFAIVSKSATKIKLMNGRLHNDEGQAIHFGHKEHDMSDDCYFWKGTQVPKQLIMEPETITQKELIKVDNAEMRRCYIEAMQPALYFNILSDGKGLKTIHKDIDDQGHEMSLMEFDFEGDSIQTLQVVDPSAGRNYSLYPTKSCTNVWDAKYSTFQDKRIAYRQGDVGLLNVEKDYERPLLET